MNRSVIFSAIVALLVVVSLGSKIAFASRYVEADNARLSGDIARALQADGFRARAVRSTLFAPIVAEKGNCRLIAAGLPANGYLDARFRIEAAGFGMVTYRYRETVTAAQPRGWPLFAEFGQKWAYRVGITVPNRPIVAVGAASVCDTSHVNWGSLRSWPIGRNVDAPGPA